MKSRKQPTFFRSAPPGNPSKARLRCAIPVSARILKQPPERSTASGTRACALSSGHSSPPRRTGGASGGSASPRHPRLGRGAGIEARRNDDGVAVEEREREGTLGSRQDGRHARRGDLARVGIQVVLRSRFSADVASPEDEIQGELCCASGTGPARCPRPEASRSTGARPRMRRSRASPLVSLGEKVLQERVPDHVRRNEGVDLVEKVSTRSRHGPSACPT